MWGRACPEPVEGRPSLGGQASPAIRGAVAAAPPQPGAAVPHEGWPPQPPQLETVIPPAGLLPAYQLGETSKGLPETIVIYLVIATEGDDDPEHLRSA